ncbi:MAG TPA: Rrf2 family transcriptional regulator [Thermomicrobiales bacterium]|nr:Rrf2 family transcriptional regulator [Thermomicrobiales bacterium]
MKVSTRGEYGLRAMVELSRRYGQGPTPLAVVANASVVPVAYLEQLIAPLRERDLVKSTRGAHGGYELARDPSEIYIGEVYRALEGPVAPMDCVSEEPVDDICPLIDGCVTRLAWVKVRDSIIDVLDSTTLADLLNQGASDRPAVASTA